MLRAASRITSRTVGAGTDTASYAFATAAVTSTLAPAEIQPDCNFENVLGSAFADTLTGNPDANVLDGGAGDDFLQGDLGSVTLTGGGGADRFWGSRDDLNGDTITDFAIGDTLIMDRRWRISPSALSVMC